MDDRSRLAGFRQASVIGPTAWGTTLAILLARNHIPTYLVARTTEESKLFSRNRQNERRLPNIEFPSRLQVTADLGMAMEDSDLVVFAVPSQTLRSNTRAVASLLLSDAIVVSGVKGLELETGNRMSEVVCQELDACPSDRVAVLSGPNLSLEVARGLPSSTVVASSSHDVARRVQAAFMSSTFRVYTNADVIGVELGGALKNIIAIGAGMGDGLGFGANTKAAFMSRGLAEITRLGVALGANPATFVGLAGMGDLVATCISPLSRNRRLGEALGRGARLDEVLSQMGQVAEGVEATSVAVRLAALEGVEMPIAQTTARVLFEGLDPTVAVEQLMTREAKDEILASP